MSQDIFNPFPPPPPPPEQKHSGLGIASLAVAVLGGLGICLTLGATTFLVATNQNSLLNSDSTLAMIGLGILCGGGANLVGAGLGIAAVFQPGVKKIFAILGLVLNVLVLCGILGIMVIGQFAPANF